VGEARWDVWVGVGLDVGEKPLGEREKLVEKFAKFQ